MSAAADGPVILARGDDYLVAIKPAGLATTGRNLDDPDCLQSQLMDHGHYQDPPSDHGGLCHGAGNQAVRWRADHL